MSEGLKWFETTNSYLPIQAGAVQLADLVASAGGHMDVLLRKTKLFSSDFNIANHTVSPRQLGQIYRNAQLMLNDAELPLRLGQQLLPSSLSSISPGLIHSPTVGHALSFLVACQAIWNPLVFIHEQTTNTDVHLYFLDAYGELNSSIEHQLAVISTMEALRSTICWLGNEQWVSQWKFELCEVKSNVLLECQSRWSGQITVGQYFSCLIIPKKQLSSPLNHASLIAYNSSKKQADLTVSSLLAVIRSQLFREIKDMPSLEIMAGRLGISPATLKRKLKAHATSYQKLVDEVRAVLNYHMTDKLNFTELEISEQLNFYDISNLRRAVRRWKTA